MHEDGELKWNETGSVKLLILPLELSGNHILSSHQVANKQELAKGMINLALRIIFVHT
jgi:hypothetical protein